MSTIFDAPELGRFLREHYRDAGDQLFRMEQLPLYNVPAQAAELARWRAGASEPDWERKQPWLDILAKEHARGLTSRRVRRFTHDLTEDELMACHWGYAHNSRYEDIRVLREGEHAIPQGLIDHDYWLVDNQYAVPMTYDHDRQFVHAELLSIDRLPEYQRDAELAWAAAEPFGMWWAGHREFQR